jgi:uncharacterized protein (DUF3820 family)
MTEPTELDEDARELIDLVNQIMPFGRFKGRRLIELPEPYLVWFHNQGFPDSLLGRRMAIMHEIKVNGLERLLAPLVAREASLETEHPEAVYTWKTE